MGVIDRAKNIVLTPKTEWPAVAGEEPVIVEIITGYMIPLALIPAVASVIGVGLAGTGASSSWTYGITAAVAAFISTVIGVCVTAYVIDYIAPNFASEREYGRALQLVVYSSTPGWIGGIVAIVPGLSLIALVATLYGLYLAYLGFPHLMKTPEDRVVLYMVGAVIALIVVNAAFGWIQGGVVSLIMQLVAS